MILLISIILVVEGSIGKKQVTDVGQAATNQCPHSTSTGKVLSDHWAVVATDYSE